MSLRVWYVSLLSLLRRAVWVHPPGLVEKVAGGLHCHKRNRQLPLPVFSRQTAPRQGGRFQEGFPASCSAPLWTLRWKAKTGRLVKQRVWSPPKSWTSAKQGRFCRFLFNSYTEIGVTKISLLQYSKIRKIKIDMYACNQLCVALSILIFVWDMFETSRGSLYHRTLYVLKYWINIIILCFTCRLFWRT